MTATEQATARGGHVTQVPVVLGAEVIAYNLTLPSGQRLHLTGPVIARIFPGQITNWHNPAITVLNPGINLPDAPITVVHRSDGSGTTRAICQCWPISAPRSWGDQGPDDFGSELDEGRAGPSPGGRGRRIEKVTAPPRTDRLDQ